MTCYDMSGLKMSLKGKWIQKQEKCFKMCDDGERSLDLLCVCGLFVSEMSFMHFR